MRLELMGGDVFANVAKKAVRLVEAGHAEASFEFNGVLVIVKPGITAADAHAFYQQELDARHAAYVATPEYKAQRREAEEREAQRTSKLAEALATAPATLSLVDVDKWATFRANNTDPYGGAVVTYAERWARVMESMMARGATVAGCAKEASHLADEEGITGFMYGCAVSSLAEMWAHGEELRQWHNLATQLGTEGEKANASGGVLNPALLSLS